MVNTWEKSYFKTPGIRVLYIVPTDTIEAILPLSIKPVPNELKRVLVGRVEIMTKNEETNYLQLLQTSGTTINKEAVFGRFYEPKLRRLLAIAPENLKETISKLLK
jgi:predicted metal-dependent phosphoesterase TrpH